MDYRYRTHVREPQPPRHFNPLDTLRNSTENSKERENIEKGTLDYQGIKFEGERVSLDVDVGRLGDVLGSGRLGESRRGSCQHNQEAGDERLSADNASEGV